MAMNRPPGRSSSQGILTIVGILAAIIAVALLVIIVSSITGKFNDTATQIAQIPTIAVIGQSQVPTAVNVVNTLPASETSAPTATATTLPTQEPSATPTAAQVVEALGATAVPAVITATSAPLPPLPFQPLPGRSFYMPRLELNSPVQVVDLPLVNQTWDVTSLGHKIGHLDATNWVGDTQGNVVLVAHIQLAVSDFGPFVYLNKTQIGDLVYLADNGKVYTYQVINITTVNPTDVTVTYPTPKPTLTLITCTTWDQTRGVFAQRLVVTAKLVNGPQSIT